MGLLSRKIKISILFIFLLLIIFAFYSEVFWGRGIPFACLQPSWSIGIYAGESPFNLSPPTGLKNPVLTAKDVTDVPAFFVADPFMIQEKGTWYLFFEVKNKRSDHGDIGLAVSKDGLNWNYRQIVLDEPFHLSYPYVFKWEDDYYMIPESSKDKSVRLYKADNFPTKWVFIKKILSGRSYNDSSIVFFNNFWWIFTTPVKNHDTLSLYYANTLFGPWKEHPKSPVIKGNAHIARPGGRLLIDDGRLFRFAQDDKPDYGNQVHAFEITELSVNSYIERQVPFGPIVKASGKGWNKSGMHHVDLHKIDNNAWICCTDGRERNNWAFTFIHKESWAYLFVIVLFLILLIF